jgi:hypothetical protein
MTQNLVRATAIALSPCLSEEAFSSGGDSICP